MELSLVVVGDAISEDQIMHAPAHIDRVDLDITHVSQRIADRGNGRIKAEGVDLESAGLLNAE